jgi:hypothetical protein
MAYALLSHTAATGNSSTVTTPPISTSGASLIVLVYTGAWVGRSAFLTDSASNTNYWSGNGQVSSTPYGTQIVVLPNPLTSATHTFTSPALANSFPGLAVLAFSGAFGGAQALTGANTTSGTTVAPGSLTPATNGCLLVTGGSCNTVSATLSINASFTVSDQVATGATSGGIAAAYLIQPTAAAANPTWTASASGDLCFQMASLALLTGGATAGTVGYGFAG